MAVYKRGKHSYQANFTFRGARYTASFATQVEAEAWEAATRAALALGRDLPAASGAQKDGVHTISDLVRHTNRKHWAHQRSGASLVRYAEIFARWVGAQLPIADALSEDRIEAFLAHRERDHRNSGSTVNRYRAGISKLVTVASRLGKLKGRPEIRKRPEGAARERVFSDSEERLILAVTQLWGYQDHADLFAWLCDTGMRLGETERLPWEAIDGRLVHIPEAITKSARPRTIALTARGLELVDRLRTRYAHIGGPFHWHNRKATRALWERLRGHFEWMDHHCVLHTWRHTCASRLIQEQGYLDPVQRWLGHSSPVVTQRYAKYAPRNMEQLAALLDRRRDAA